MKLAFALMQRGRPWVALAEIDAALLVLDGTSGAWARAQRAIILHQGGRLDEALAEFQAVLPTLRKAGDLLGIQKMLINRAYLQADRHAFGSAVADLIEAEGLARQLGRDLTIGIIAENLGLVESVRGDVPAALVHFSRAEQIIGAHGAQLGHVYQHRAELLLSVGLVAEAREVAERAALAFRYEGRLLKLSEVRLLLSQAAFLDRDWQAAITHARQAKREFTRQQRVEWSWQAQLAVLRAQLASGVRVQVANRDVDTMLEILSASGWPVAALEARLAAARIAARRGSSWTEQAHLRQASLIASQPGPVTLRARGWYARALLRQRYGDVPGALRGVRTGLRILDEHSAVLGTADLRAHAAVHRAELTELGLRIALETGRPGAVFEWAERGRASQLMHRAVLPPDDPELARMLSELRSTAGELDRLRDSGRGGAALARRQIALERQIRDHCRLHRGTSNGRLAAPVSPSRLGQQLGGWVLLEFVQLDGVLRCLSLVDGRLRLRDVGSAAQIADLIERLSFALHRMARRDGRAQSRSAAVTLLRATAARLDVLLLGSLPEIGERPLVVVPTGPLHSLPWSILPSCAGRPVAVSPSATVWHSISTRPADVAGRVVVAAGPKLTGARAEAEAVAAIYQTTALVQDAANVAAVLASLATASLVHLAAHGRLSADNPLFSDLLLSDGPMVVYDVERLAQVPHTVVLAACDSGRSVVRTGDELLGLCAAFIARGAAQLVASVVSLPDAETASLMVAFHRRLAAGQPAAIALADAQQELRDEEPATLAAAAGFVCLGAGISAPGGGGGH